MNPHLQYWRHQKLVKSVTLREERWNRATLTKKNILSLVFLIHTVSQNSMFHNEKLLVCVKWPKLEYSNGTKLKISELKNKLSWDHTQIIVSDAKWNRGAVHPQSSMGVSCCALLCCLKDSTIREGKLTFKHATQWVTSTTERLTFLYWFNQRPCDVFSYNIKYNMVPCYSIQIHTTI